MYGSLDVVRMLNDMLLAARSVTGSASGSRWEVYSAGDGDSSYHRHSERAPRGTSTVGSFEFLEADAEMAEALQQEEYEVDFTPNTEDL